MERLPHDPKNLRDIVETDLCRAARLVIKVQDEIDPQFRIATPEGDFHLAVMLPSDLHGRRTIFRNFELFMTWKQALGFTLASELYQPDSVYCVGFMGRERHACLARITRTPKPWTVKNFGPVEWLPDSSIDPMLSGMLPQGVREMNAKDLSTLEKWFGARGKFPAIKIATGELGL